MKQNNNCLAPGAGGGGGEAQSSGYGRDHLAHLKPQIGHNIGFQAPSSSQSAWATRRPGHGAHSLQYGVGWSLECARLFVVVVFGCFFG